MRKEEAQRISAIVTGLGLAKDSVCLNIGSSTLHFREVMQPHISKHLIRPIEASGIRVIHCDIKKDEGVDLVGDVFNPKFQKKMENTRADVLLCCNILEHLPDPRSFAIACNKLVRSGGYIVVSVPLSYPYHPDPIDTMLRPTPDELATFFPHSMVIVAEILTTNSFLDETLKKNVGGWILLKHLLKVLFTFYRPRQWWPKAHRLLWSFRTYKSSLVVFQKPLQ
jgi:SAM-dependent methyltransferase